MDQLDKDFLRAAWCEAERAGLLLTGQAKLHNGWLVEQTWLDPVYAYCGAAA